MIYIRERIIVRRKIGLVDEENGGMGALLVFSRLGSELPSGGQLRGEQKTGEADFPLKNRVPGFCRL